MLPRQSESMENTIEEVKKLANELGFRQTALNEFKTGKLFKAENKDVGLIFQSTSTDKLHEEQVAVSKKIADYNQAEEFGRMLEQAYRNDKNSKLLYVIARPKGDPEAVAKLENPKIYGDRLQVEKAYAGKYYWEVYVCLGPKIDEASFENFKQIVRDLISIANT